MTKKLTTKQVLESFLLFCEADNLFSTYGAMSAYAELELLEYCAKFIVNKNIKEFINNTEMCFDFNKKKVDKILKKFNKQKKELFSVYYNQK